MKKEKAEKPEKQWLRCLLRVTMRRIIERSGAIFPGGRKMYHPFFYQT